MGGLFCGIANEAAEAARIVDASAAGYLLPVCIPTAEFPGGTRTRMVENTDVFLVSLNGIDRGRQCRQFRRFIFHVFHLLSLFKFAYIAS